LEVMLVSPDFVHVDEGDGRTRSGRGHGHGEALDLGAAAVPPDYRYDCKCHDFSSVAEPPLWRQSYDARIRLRPTCRSAFRADRRGDPHFRGVT